MPRSQLIVILALALLCGLAAGTFVYFMAAAPDVPPRPAAVQPVHVASPSPPSVVSLPTQSAENVPTMDATRIEPPVAAAATKMKPETTSEMEPSEMDTPRSAASLEQRVRHARRQCHQMAERICRCHPQTCSQQRQAHRDADRTVVEAARNLQRMPDVLNQMLRQMEQSCRETYEAVRRSMPQCF